MEKKQIQKFLRPVVFIQGTTASGKSDLALRLAQEFQGEVVNCDSIQVYKHLVIGSALPSQEDFSRCPHHLFAYVKPMEEMTAGKYCDDFFAKLSNGKTPLFVVGGTGFYFQALEKGMYPVSKVSQETKDLILSQIEEDGGLERLYVELQNSDPMAAAKIHPNDAYRIGRALEIFRTEGKSLSQILEQENKGPRLDKLLKIGMKWEKDALSTRIAQRTRLMLKRGLVEETKNILDQGWKAWAPMRSVGYKETIEFVEGTLKQDELENQINIHTQQLAKKQRTWFQRDGSIHWLNPETEKHKISELVREFLSTQTLP